MSSFFDFGKNFAPPPGIRPSFLAPGGWDSLAQKKFLGVARRGECMQLELTETLEAAFNILSGFLSVVKVDKNIDQMQESTFFSCWFIEMKLMTKLF